MISVGRVERKVLGEDFSVLGCPCFPGATHQSARMAPNSAHALRLVRDDAQTFLKISLASGPQGLKVLIEKLPWFL